MSSLLWPIISNLCSLSGEAGTWLRKCRGWSCTTCGWRPDTDIPPPGWSSSARARASSPTASRRVCPPTGPGLTRQEAAYWSVDDARISYSVQNVYFLCFVSLELYLTISLPNMIFIHPYAPCTIFLFFYFLRAEPLVFLSSLWLYKRLYIY